MNTNSLTASLLEQLQQGQGLQQVSQQLGLDQSQTSQAISAALPLFMGALGNNASEPLGAQSLLNALQKDHLGGGGGGGVAGIASACVAAETGCGVGGTVWSIPLAPLALLCVPIGPTSERRRL